MNHFWCQSGDAVSPGGEDRPLDKEFNSSGHICAVGLGHWVRCLLVCSISLIFTLNLGGFNKNHGKMFLPSHSYFCLWCLCGHCKVHSCHWWHCISSSGLSLAEHLDPVPLCSQQYHQLRLGDPAHTTAWKHWSALASLG